MLARQCREVIGNLVGYFRCLDGWRITYDPRASLKGQCYVGDKIREAVIYAWGSRTPQPDDYLFHEILHVAYRAARQLGHDGEEQFVQDLCAICLPLRYTPWKPARTP